MVLVPKFEVQIESKDDISFEDEKVQVVVRANQIHGNEIRGTADVLIIETDLHLLEWEAESSDAILMKKTTAFESYTTIEFDIENDMKFINTMDGDKNYIIVARVTEALTGFTESIQKMVHIYHEPFAIAIDCCDESDCKLKQGSTINFIVYFY